MSHLVRLLRRTGMIAVLIGSFSSSAAADPITLVFVDRFVGASARATTAAGNFESHSFTNSELPGLFNIVATAQAPPPELNLPTVASSTATQHTDVSTTHWSGAGMAHSAKTGDRSVAGAGAHSWMDIGFTLTEPMSYLFTGTLTGGAAVSLWPDSIEFLWAFNNSGPTPMVAMRRGLLPPGAYNFNANAYSDTNFPRPAGGAAFDVQFTLADPVPEPATLLLFGTGAAFVGRTAWRRRREQSATGSADPIGDA